MELIGQWEGKEPYKDGRFGFRCADGEHIQVDNIRISTPGPLQPRLVVKPSTLTADDHCGPVLRRQGPRPKYRLEVGSEYAGHAVLTARSGTCAGQPHAVQLDIEDRRRPLVFLEGQAD